VVRPGSHLMSAGAGANVLVMVPDGDGFASGEIVRAMILEADALARPRDGAR
jgi:molybdopterin biosynthesis enzyme